MFVGPRGDIIVKEIIIPYNKDCFWLSSYEGKCNLEEIFLLEFYLETFRGYGISMDMTD